MGLGEERNESEVTRKITQGEPMRNVIVLSTTAAALVLGGLAATPALAATGSQIVAFTVADGVLAITPGTPALGVNSLLSGGVTTVSVALGVTTVLDSRIASTGWAVSASTTDFTLTQAPGATSLVIPKANAKFSVPLAPLSVVGTPALTFARVSAPQAVDATGDVVNLVVATATGVNTGSFAPQLDAVVPNGTPTGAYTGTITQTVV